LGLLGAGHGHHEHELLAPAPHQDVHAPGRRAHALDEGAQHVVPHGVPVRVVDVLEVIEIHPEQAEGRLRSPRALELLDEARRQVSPVEGERQVVGDREPLEPRALDGRDRAVGQQARQELVGGRERVDLRRRYREHPDGRALGDERLDDHRPDREALPLGGDEARVLARVDDAGGLGVLEHPSRHALVGPKLHGGRVASGPRARAREQVGSRGVEQANRGMVAGQDGDGRVRDGAQGVLERAPVGELLGQLKKDEQVLERVERHGDNDGIHRAARATSRAPRRTRAAADHSAAAPLPPP
jgi:hypothetical protein